MDTEILWDIWYYFIVYGIWIILGFELLHKVSFLKSLRKNLCKDYKTYPDLSISKKWRSYFTFYLSLIALFMLALALIKSISFFYVLPVLIITCLVYVNRKIKSGIFDLNSTVFYNDNGFTIFPDRIKLFSSSYYKWEDIEKVTVLPKKSHTIFELKIQGINKKIIIKSTNKFYVNYVDILKNYVKEMRR
jgi:hypothetical protein